MAFPSDIRPTLSDYTVLPITFPPMPSFPTPATHYIYLRPHSPKIPAPDSPRSLFLANIPIDSTELHFRSLFADQLGGGRVERVQFDTAAPPKKQLKAAAAATGKKRKRADRGDEELVARMPEVWDRELQPSGSAAVVVFVDRPSMELALRAARKAAKSGAELVWGKGIEGALPKLGSARYRTHHSMRFPDADVLQEAVDAYMTAFAAREAAQTRRLARQRQVPDAEGFVTVTRGGRTGPARVDGANEKLEREKQREAEKREGMGDFYRFQVRERKKARAGELVRKFEMDRRRVEELRRVRRGKFKPM